MRSRLMPIFVAVILIGGGVYLSQRSSTNNGDLILSGTIEVTETNLPTVSGGRVKQVNVREGDQIQQDENLVDIYSETSKVNETINTPITCVFLARLDDPTKFAAPAT